MAKVATERLRPVQVRRHLLDNLREEGEGDEAGLEAGLDSRVLEVRAAQRLVVRRQPPIEFLDLRRVGGAQQDLGDQSIRIQSDRRYQLVDAHGARLRLPWRYPGRDEHQDGHNGDSGFHEEPLHAGGYIMAQPEFLATPARNPIENGTFGAIDAFVRVELPSPGRHTRLEVPYSRENARHVDERSLRLFAWDGASRSLVLVNASGVDPERRVVWGVIDASGLYGAIGLPRDPDLLRRSPSFRCFQRRNCERLRR